MSAWKISQAHKWVECPHTVYERRRELRVREAKQTAIAWDKRYYDTETGKFIRDKLPVINSYSLADLVESRYDYSQDARHTVSGWYRDEVSDPVVDRVISQPKFVPKDNDFDREIEEDRKREALKARREAEEDNRKQLERLRIEAEERKRKIAELETEYQRMLEDARKRQESKLIYLNGDLRGKPVDSNCYAGTNIIKSGWGRE